MIADSSGINATGKLETAETSHQEHAPAQRVPILLVGPGWRFTSGLSYYTCRLANAIAEHHEVSVIQLRQLLPRCLYPGRKRVGRTAAQMTFPACVPVFNGIDWWWGISILKALYFMRARQPKVLVFEWWTAVALHTYLVLAIVARLLGTKVVIELHEFQDPAEARLAVARQYARGGLRLLLRLSHGCVVHSKFDWRALEASYRLENTRIAVAPHGPYDQYKVNDAWEIDDDPAVTAVKAAPRPGVINLLFFGIIRPYKGLEELLTVFNGFSAEEVSRLWLTVVGETWNGCAEPARLIRTSPHRDRITFVNEYVSDAAAAAAFSHADMVIIPYRRSSSSGTLHIAMNCGLPIVATNIGGLPAAASGYEGIVFVQPGDIQMLRDGIEHAIHMVDQHFSDPRTWAETVKALLYAAGSLSPVSAPR